ncbi:hypothetical protein CEXT_289031 [Caerostris extrusa]|uniref:Uncharacterized protein n=1 Tax=Caerostris extrusa TaxID=172846 RepID=A0AAV4XWB2_CAEEX|nr:hypothetical protein CEXT_289031 [Caerostris extrusa]
MDRRTKAVVGFSTLGPSSKPNKISRTGMPEMNPINLLVSKKEILTPYVFLPRGVVSNCKVNIFPCCEICVIFLVVESRIYFLLWNLDYLSLLWNLPSLWNVEYPTVESL